jgi:hypothetical protein
VKLKIDRRTGLPLDLTGELTRAIVHYYGSVAPGHFGSRITEEEERDGGKNDVQVQMMEVEEENVCSDGENEKETAAAKENLVELSKKKKWEDDFGKEKTREKEEQETNKNKYFFDANDIFTTGDD